MRPSAAATVVQSLIYLTLLLPLSISSATAQQVDTSALINEALDKPVKMELKTTLPTALQTITKQTGVPIDADRSVYELLPWGEQTNVDVTIENQTLREALAAIARKLGLDFVLKPESVELRPLPALRRLSRRATVDELRALDLLGSTPLQLNNTRPTLRQLVDGVDAKLQSLKSDFAVEFRAGDTVRAEQPVSVPRNATMAQALEAIAQETDATWYPWGGSVVVVSKEDQVRNQLEKAVTVRYNGVELAQVLSELSQMAGVAFSIEPGAIQRVPPEFRTVKLLLENASIRQALENIAGFTGLGYVVNAKGVYIWNQSATPGAGGGPRDPIIGTIQLKDGMQLFVRESQVPADVRDYMRQKLKTEVEGIRKQMRDEGFKPAQPATTQTAPSQDL
jgi:hypothetical protein